MTIALIKIFQFWIKFLDFDLIFTWDEMDIFIVSIFKIFMAIWLEIFQFYTVLYYKIVKK